MHKKSWLYFGVALLVLAAFVIRIYHLDTVPLRGDEAYSILHWTAPPFTERWERLIREEPAPVGAFTMYWAWKALTGESEFAVRYLSLLGNVAGLAVVLALAKRLFYVTSMSTDEAYLAPTALWIPAFAAGVLWAVHPYLVWHSQDARVYGVLSVLSPLAFYALVRAVFTPLPQPLPHKGRGEQYKEADNEHGQATPLRLWGRLYPLNKDMRARRAASLPFGWWGLYVMVQTAAIYLYYLEPFWVAAQGLYVLLVIWRMDVVKQAVQAWVVIGVLSIPVMAQLYHLMFVSNYEGNAISADFGAFFSEFVPTLLFGNNVWHPAAGAVVLGVLLAGLGWLWWRETSTSESPELTLWSAPTMNGRPLVSGLLLLWILVPNVLLYGASFFSDFFRPRYVTTVIPALIVAFVIVPLTPDPSPIRGEGRYSRRWWTGTGHALALRVLVVVGVVVAVSIVEIYDYYVNDPPKAADWRGLAAYLEARTTSEDVILSDSVDPALEYYYRSPARVLFIPKDNPDPAVYLPQLLADYNAIFLLQGERSGDVGQYLQANAQHIPGDTYPGVVQYRAWGVDDTEIQTSLEVQFGDLAILRGYTLLDATTLIFYWEAREQTENEHSILVHLENTPDAPPVAVLDHGVAGAVVSMRSWQPGIIYRDPVALPPDLPVGNYSIYVAIYESISQARVGITDYSETRLAVGEIQKR